MKSLKSIAKFTDHTLSKIHRGILGEKGALLTFLFHSIFKNEKEMSKNHANPQQNITVKKFEEFIKYYLSKGYIFVSPDDIIKGLNKDRRYILITFDDGYFNNSLILPVLKKYSVPALFFVSTDHVVNKKGFWWDVLYRKHKRGIYSDKAIVQETKKLKSMTNNKIEEYLKRKFGKDVLKPVSNIDRPFTESELKKFSKNKYVFIGNHTMDHAILTNYSSKGIEEQISGAQEALKKITGKKPSTIAYPNGNYSDEIIKIAKKCGLKLGITVDLKKNQIPIGSNNYMKLGRFVLNGKYHIKKQCEYLRSDLTIINKVKRLKKALIR